ncbi:hypothetical protein SEA_STELLA_84 [Streptomyces phage Stella]|nr:hypothetical protein SEA_STELLA_84 [Streptomyces phage Stella]
MALKALDKTYENFETGDKVVHDGYGAPYGVRILKKIYLDTTGDYHFVCAEGDVVSGKWKDAQSGGEIILSLHTAKTLRKYQSKWTPGIQVAAGDVLKDQDGVLFLVASLDVVWNLSKGTKTTLAKWEAAGTDYGNRKFTKQTTASGHEFSSVVELKDKWSNRF